MGMMAVEDHKDYQKWLQAFERRNEAEKRYYHAVMSNSAEAHAAEHDLKIAQADYDNIADTIV